MAPRAVTCSVSGASAAVTRASAAALATWVRSARTPSAIAAREASTAVAMRVSTSARPSRTAERASPVSWSCMPAVAVCTALVTVVSRRCSAAAIRASVDCSIVPRAVATDWSTWAVSWVVRSARSWAARSSAVVPSCVVAAVEAGRRPCSRARRAGRRSGRRVRPHRGRRQRLRRGGRARRACARGFPARRSGCRAAPRGWATLPCRAPTSIVAPVTSVNDARRLSRFWTWPVVACGAGPPARPRCRAARRPCPTWVRRSATSLVRSRSAVIERSMRACWSSSTLRTRPTSSSSRPTWDPSCTPAIVAVTLGARHAAADEGAQLGGQPLRRHLGEVLVVDRRVAHVERAARRHVLGGGHLERAAHGVDQRVPVVGVDRHPGALGPEPVELVEQRVDPGLLRRHVSSPSGRRRGRRRRACDRSGGGTRSPTCTSSPAGCAAGRSTGRGRRPPGCR